MKRQTITEWICQVGVVVFLGAFLSDLRAEDPAITTKWLHELTAIKQLGVRASGEYQLPQEPNYRLHFDMLLQFDGTKTSVHATVQENDEAPFDVITAFDGKKAYDITRGSDHMSVGATFTGYSGTGFLWNNTVALLASGVHPRWSGNAFFSPSLAMLTEDAKAPGDGPAVAATAKIAGGLRVDWAPTEPPANRPRRNWCVLKSTTFDETSGLPLHAVLVDGRTGDTDEWKVTSQQSLPTDPGQEIAFPKTYEYRSGIPQGGGQPKFIIHWTIKEVKINQGLDETEFQPDPRKYGIKAIYDRGTHKMTPIK